MVPIIISIRFVIQIEGGGGKVRGRGGAAPMDATGFGSYKPQSSADSKEIPKGFMITDTLYGVGYEKGFNH